MCIRDSERSARSASGAGELRDRPRGSVIRHVYALAVRADGKVVRVGPRRYGRFWAQRSELARFSVAFILRDGACTVVCRIDVLVVGAYENAMDTGPRLHGRFWGQRSEL